MKIDKLKLEKILNIVCYCTGLLFFSAIVWKFYLLLYMMFKLIIVKLIINLPEIIETSKGDPLSFVLMLSIFSYCIFGSLSYCIDIIIKCYKQIIELIKRNKEI